MSGKISKLKLKNVVFDDSEEDEDETGYDWGLSLEKLSLGPKKKLLVLSIGGLLVHRVFRKNMSRIPTHRRPDAVLGNHLVYRRPYSEEFMKFCFERFQVGIWSSAIERNADAALEFVMRGMKNKLLFTWDQEKCTDTGFGTLEKKEKPIFLKELKKVWLKGSYSSSNTLLIDDKPYKALLNPPYTAIFPTEYTADIVDDNSLGPKGDLRLYLDGLADSDDDVPSYVKEHPFGQSAITPLHSDWKFYSKIINKIRKD